ncbi:MAG: tRNA dimethylallyltransferase [Candidatus Azotimanducaceae bacterium]|jgi:tRNA dimethylallyltransferase
MGPTASGKTGLSVELAQDLNGEIISVDSALVYRGMDIGTAKPSPTEMAGVPHHLIDTRDPATAYSAADFRTDALRLIDEISARGHLPILTGGTMLYFKALKHGLAVMPEANQQIRNDISARGSALGWSVIHDELARVDPKAAQRINPNDGQRLQRALEVYLISGKSLSDWQSEPLPDCPVDLIELAIVPPDRQLLHQRIEARFRLMLEHGLVAEVDTLYRREDLHSGLPAIKSVGYRQVWAYLENEIDFETMVQKAIVATRQLAKRQYTWLRSWEDLRVIEAPLRTEALKIIG